MKTYNASPVEPFGDYGVFIGGDGPAGRQAVVCFGAESAYGHFKQCGGEEHVRVASKDDGPDFFLSNPVWEEFVKMVEADEPLEIEVDTAQ